MSDEEKEALIEEIITGLAAGLIDESDDDIEEELKKYDLSPEDLEDIMDTIYEVRGAEDLLNDEEEANLDADVDALDEMADQNTATAQRMANEDNTNVTITEEDTDGDGDTDTTTITKEDTEDDGNSDESDDKPHDSFVTGNKPTGSDWNIKDRVNNMKSNWGKTATQKKRDTEKEELRKAKAMQEAGNKEKREQENSTNNIAKHLANYRY